MPDIDMELDWHMIDEMCHVEEEKELQRKTGNVLKIENNVNCTINISFK